jgi:hypothetical protein
MEMLADIFPRFFILLDTVFVIINIITKYTHLKVVIFVAKLAVVTPRKFRDSQGTVEGSLKKSDFTSNNS